MLGATNTTLLTCTIDVQQSLTKVSQCSLPIFTGGLGTRLTAMPNIRSTELSVSCDTLYFSDYAERPDKRSALVRKQILRWFSR